MADNSFSYAAANCLGVPTKFPKYGDFSSTFVMREYGPWWDSRYRDDSGQYANLSDFGTGFDHFIDLKFEHSGLANNSIFFLFCFFKKEHFFWV